MLLIKKKPYTIYAITYHYVREISKSKYPNIKGIEIKEFESQMRFLKKNFNILSSDEFTNILKSNSFKKKPSVLLTFDDGYKDHFKYVFPVLNKLKISGFFFPVTSTLKRNLLLNVNKIHLILEKVFDKKKLLNRIFEEIELKTGKKPEDLKLEALSLKSKFDDRDTVFIKRLLQFYLPKKIREKITNKLFNEIANIDNKEILNGFYLNQTEVIEMSKNNMNFGIHSENHLHLAKLSYQKQLKEINMSLNYFKNIGILSNIKSICYPHGSWNNDTIKILKKNKILFGLTTERGDINVNNIKKNFILPRLDVKEFFNI